MAEAQVANVNLRVDKNYIKCAEIIHWQKDYFDPSCDDTWELLKLNDKELKEGILKSHKNIDINKVLDRLHQLEHEINKLNKKNIDIKDFITTQDSYFWITSSDVTIGEYDGDEFDVGDYVESVLEDFKKTFNI